MHRGALWRVSEPRLRFKPSLVSPLVIIRSWMTFCPEWLTGSPNLDTSNPLYLWVYLTVSCFTTNTNTLALIILYVLSS